MSVCTSYFIPKGKLRSANKRDSESARNDELRERSLLYYHSVGHHEKIVFKAANFIEHVGQRLQQHTNAIHRMKLWIQNPKPIQNTWEPFRIAPTKTDGFSMNFYLQLFYYKETRMKKAQAMLPALEAILGQRSAHSFDTGPVIADPFISP